MILECRAAPPFMKNGFLVGCERTRQAVCIDPGDEVDELVAAADEAALEVTRILLTHAHVDHVSGVARAKRAWNAPIHLHRDDLFLYEDAAAHGALFGLQVEAPPPVDVFYDLSLIRFGDCTVTVSHTPGHCPGGVCLAVGAVGRGQAEATPLLFVGDTLFAGSIGRTDLPGGNYDTLMTSIAEVLLAFADDTPVYPGHGPETTIGRERRTNPFILDWLARRR